MEKFCVPCTGQTLWNLVCIWHFQNINFRLATFQASNSHRTGHWGCGIPPVLPPCPFLCSKKWRWLGVGNPATLRPRKANSGGRLILWCRDVETYQAASPIPNPGPQGSIEGRRRGTVCTAVNCQDGSCRVGVGVGGVAEWREWNVWLGPARMRTVCQCKPSQTPSNPVSS